MNLLPDLSMAIYTLIQNLLLVNLIHSSKNYIRNYFIITLII